MPQFDKVSFLSQIHWLIILFFSLYYILLIYTPNVLLLLKLRKKRLIQFTHLLALAEKKQQLNQDTFSLVFKRVTNFSKNIINKTNTALISWNLNFIKFVFSGNIEKLVVSYFFNLVFFKTSAIKRLKV